MKKTVLFSLLFIPMVTFGQIQTKTKSQNSIDKEANIALDSLSKVYKVKVVSCLKEQFNGEITTSIGYYDDKGLVYKVIKTEKVK
jgi:hypothetical protein